MRIVFLIILTFLLSCNSNPDKESKKVNENSLKNEQEDIQIDTLSFKYYLSLIDNSKTIPKYLYDSFIPSKWISEDDPNRRFKGVDKIFNIDSVCIVKLNTTYVGVCSASIIVTYGKSGEIISTLEIQNICDGDSNESNSLSMIGVVYNDSIVEVSKVFESNDDSNITDLKYFVIRRDGFIEMILDGEEFRYFSDEDCLACISILKNKDLSGLESNELRLMRNEIFARQGYVFKDSSLNKYFKGFDWYNPQTDNLKNIKLNAVEIYNIKQIQRLEDSINMCANKQY